MNATITYPTIAADDEASLRELYALYEVSITASERKSFEQLRAMLARPDYRFVLARDGACGTAVGLAVLFVTGDFGLLEYLAVAPDRRSGGVGSGLFRHCAGMVTGPLLVEVDSPADPVVGDRRIAFYRRLGCRRVAGLVYQLPLPGDPPPMGLFLCDPVPASHIPLAIVRHYLATLYARVYGRPADDPRLAAMAAGLPDPVPLV